MDLFDAKSAALIIQPQRQQVAYLLVGGYAVNIRGYRHRRHEHLDSVYY